MDDGSGTAAMAKLLINSSYSPEPPLPESTDFGEESSGGGKEDVDQNGIEGFDSIIVKSVLPKVVNQFTVFVP